MTQDADRYPWLCIEPFVADFAGARALSSAFELGFIDVLASGPLSMESVRERMPLDQRGLQLLLAMLRSHDVVETDENTVYFTPVFRQALAFRDLLEARLYFAHLVAPDFLHLSTALLADPDVFFRHARLFRLFSYDRCITRTEENLQATARWMRITTALTRYEALACIGAYDFSGARRLLDVGGNSGEFLLRICKAHPALAGTVYDLPVVCEIGRSRVADEPEGARIDFVEAKGGDEPLPQGNDLISFKSMLHDWPEADMRGFLRRAHAALPPGGTVLIFERAWPEELPQPLSYGQLPLLLFFRSYRRADDYRVALEATGFREIAVAQLALDMPFILITARK